MELKPKCILPEMIDFSLLLSWNKLRRSQLLLKEVRKVGAFSLLRQILLDKLMMLKVKHALNLKIGYWHLMMS